MLSTQTVNRGLSSSSKSAAFKNELFIQRSVKKNSTGPQGCQTPRVKTQKAFFLSFSFCVNFVKIPLENIISKRREWQTTALAVIEQKSALPAGRWPLRPHGKGGGAEMETGGISTGTGSLFIITGRPWMEQA